MIYYGTVYRINLSSPNHIRSTTQRKVAKMKKDSKEVEYAFTYSNHIKLFSNDKYQLFILMKNGFAQIR